MTPSGLPVVVVSLVALGALGPSAPLGNAPPSPPATLAGIPFGPPSAPLRPGGLYSAVADFNEDGHPDLAGAVEAQDIASILPGNGAGGFGPELVASVGDGPFAAATGDFNEDGHVDLVVTNSNDLSLLLGRGDGTFRPERRSALGVDIASYPAIGDFNADGHADVAVAVRNPYVVAVLLGNGDGSLRPVVHYPAVIGRPRTIVVGDFDEDGIADLAIGSESYYEMAVLRGIGDGTFAPALYSNPPAAMFDLALGDFNRDGHQDLAGGNSGGGTAAVVLLGRGDGTFAPIDAYPLERLPMVLARGDFNRDGFDDLVAASMPNYSDAHLLFFLAGSGTGSFVTEGSRPITGYLQHLLAVDLDGDGDEDLVQSVGAIVLLNQTGPPGSCTDGDTDGFGAPGDRSCPRGAATDCDDSNPARSPGVPDLCDGADNDCDGLVDEGFDADADGWTTCAGDCDDLAATVSPGAPETCNGIDDNCDGSIDEEPSAHLACDDDGFPCSSVSCTPDLFCSDDASSCAGSDAVSALFPGAYVVTPNDPYSIASGDLDGDGRADLVVATASSRDLTILKGAGDGTFRRLSRIPVGDYPGRVAVADMDGDGRLDLVVRAGDLLVLRGNGDGSFGAPARHAAGEFGGGIAIADLDGDGAPDVATANNEHWDVSVFLGNGDGTLGPQSRLAAGPGANDVAVADFDRDGHADLAVTNYFDESVSILRGLGDGSFAPEARFGVGSGPLAVAVGDFDEDANPDLVVTGLDIFSVLLGNGDGTFAPARRILVASSPKDVAVADLDGDGHRDLAVSGRSGVVTTLRGDGLGDFVPGASLPAGEDSWGIVVADLDEDGDPDLATADGGSDGVTVHLGAGDGTFPSALRRFQAGSRTGGVGTGDFNGDAIPDLAVTDLDLDQVSILLGEGDGDFALLAAYPVGDTPQSVAVADLDGDGALDLAVACQALVSILRGRGDGGFDAGVPLAAPDEPKGVAASDVNVDGRVDLLVLNSRYPNMSFSVFLGNGDGTFALRGSIRVQIFPNDLAVGDLNGDRFPDVAVVHADYGLRENLSVHLGNGDGTFQPRSRLLMEHIPVSIAIGDLDEDGIADLATSNWGDASVLLGRGDGTFDVRTFGAVTGPWGSSTSAMIGDFDLDGAPDLLASHGAFLAIMPGSGDGDLEAEALFLVGGGINDAAAADFNGDGRLDVALANDTADVVVALNQGPTSGCLDRDGDGFGWPGNPACPGGPALDCDDRQATVHPRATEFCDLLDNDCDLAIDERQDADGDGYTGCDGDCVDSNPGVHPGAVELPGNPVDEDCDGSLGACDPTAPWDSHWAYVRCVVEECKELVASGGVTARRCGGLILQAARSDVGR